MSENDASTKSLSGRATSSGKFLKGKSGNPAGRRKGSLSKTTQLRQIMTEGMWTKAQAVLQQVIQRAGEGSEQHEEMVLRTIIAPFLRREADDQADEARGNGKGPNITINVGLAAGAKPIEGKVVRVLDG